MRLFKMQPFHWMQQMPYVLQLENLQWKFSRFRIHQIGIGVNHHYLVRDQIETK